MPLDFTAKFPRPSIWLVAGVFAMHSSAQVGEVLKVEFDDFSGSRTLEWNDMAEDQWGSIYVAVDRDIVYSRGGQWMPMPERTFEQRAINLMIDELDRLWVGTPGDVGFYQLSPDADPAWVSVRDYFDHPEGRNHWQPHLYDPETQCVYFSGFGRVVAWHIEGPLREWEVRGGVYAITKTTEGVLAITNLPRFLRLLPDETTELAVRARPRTPSAPPLNGWAQTPDGAVLLATERGVYILQGDRPLLLPLQGEGIEEDPATRFIAPLPDGGYLILLRQPNLLLETDASGKVRYTRQAQTNPLHTHPELVMQDSQGALWIGDGVGLHRLSLDTPISVFGLSQSISGIISAITEHDGRIYVTTSAGLFGSENNLGEKSFRRIGQITDCGNPVSTPEGLILCSSEGLVRVVGDEVEVLGRGQVRRFEIVDGETPRLYAPRREGFRILIGSADNRVFEWVDVIKKFTEVRDAEWGRNVFAGGLASTETVRIKEEAWGAYALNLNRFGRIRSEGFELGLQRLGGVRGARAATWLRDSTGKEWFGSRSGIIRVDTDAPIIAPTIPTPLVRQTFNLANQSSINLAGAALSPETRSIRIQYELPDFSFGD